VNAIMTYSWQKPSENHERKLEDLKLRNVARHYSSQHGNSLQEVMVLTFPSLAFDSPDPKHNKESNTTQHTNAAISTMASSLEMNDIANEVISQALTAEGKSGEGEFVCPCLLGLSNASFQGVEKADVKMQLMGIPADLHLELFKQLSPITSACLSLTCKAFHSIHWSLHGKVGLEEEDEQFKQLSCIFCAICIVRPCWYSKIHAGRGCEITKGGISEGGTSCYCGISGTQDTRGRGTLAERGLAAAGSSSYGGILGASQGS
jgi:hypothetical protein